MAPFAGPEGSIGLARDLAETRHPCSNGSSVGSPSSVGLVVVMGRGSVAFELVDLAARARNPARRARQRPGPYVEA